MGKALPLILVFALVLAPGCELITLPLKILDGLTSVLFFWAKNPASALLFVEGPALAGFSGEALPLSDALRHAVALDASGTAWVVPEDTALPGPPQPPFPGAVLVSIKILDEELDPALLEVLEERGIRLQRVSAP